MTAMAQLDEFHFSAEYQPFPEGLPRQGWQYQAATHLGYRFDVLGDGLVVRSTTLRERPVTKINRNWNEEVHLCKDFFFLKVSIEGGRVIKVSSALESELDHDQGWEPYEG